MSLNAAALRLLAEKGLTASDIAELAEVLEVRRDPTAAERMRRMRAKRAERVTVTRNVTDEPSLDDIYSNPTGLDGSSEPSAVSDFSVRVVEVWNVATDGTPLPKARKLTADRRKHLKARVKEHGEEAVMTAIANMAASDWHSGRSGKWTEGNLGWLLKSDENFVKMLERPTAISKAAKPVTDADRAALRQCDELRKAYEAREITFDQYMSRKAAALREGDPPPAANRTASARGQPIGQLVQRIAGTG